MTTDRSEVAAIEQPDQHREAYALMRYESAETPTPSVSRVVWNSRDGVTPFGFTDPETGIGLTHVRWHEDVRKPDHVPHPDQLVFITEWPTIEEFTDRARRMIERAPQYAPPEGPDRDALVKQLAEGLMRDCGEHGQPAVVTGRQYLEDLGVL